VAIQRQGKSPSGSDINRLEHHGPDRCLDKGLKAFKRLCTGSSGSKFTQAGKRASGEGTKKAREGAKGSLKNGEEQYDKGDSMSRRVQNDGGKKKNE